MSDNRPRPAAAPDARPEPSLAELVEVAVRRILTSIVIAGGLIALAVYSQGDPPRYQVTAADGRIIRINTQSGTVIACEEENCAIILERGQSLDDKLPPRALPKQEARPAPALPAPAPGNEAAPAPAAR